MGSSLQATCSQRGWKRRLVYQDTRSCRGIRAAHHGLHCRWPRARLRPTLSSGREPTSSGFQWVSLPNRNSEEESSWTNSSPGHRRGPSGCNDVCHLPPLLCVLDPLILRLYLFCSTPVGSPVGSPSPSSLRRRSPGSPCPAQAVAAVLSHFTINTGQRCTKGCPVGSPACHTDTSALPLRNSTSISR